MKLPFSRKSNPLGLRIDSSASLIVTSYRLALTVPRTSLLGMMFFWLWRDSIRRTSTRLASLTWISTVPTSFTLTSAAVTGLAGCGASAAAAAGWVDGRVDGWVVGLTVPAANGSTTSSSGRTVGTDELG